MTRPEISAREGLPSDDAMNLLFERVPPSSVSPHSTDKFGLRGDEKALRIGLRQPGSHWSEAPFLQEIVV